MSNPNYMAPQMAPTPSVIIPQIISDNMPTFITNIFLLNYNQTTINRLANLLTSILNIEDSSGNKYGDYRTNTGSSQTYGNLLYGFLGYSFIAVLKQPFVDQLIALVGQFPPLFNNLINTMYNYQTDAQIMQLYTIVFNNKHTFPSAPEEFVPMITTIANNVLNPQPVNPPPVVDTNTRTIDEVNRDLTYLTSLGLTEESDNETMKKTLKRYKNLTGTKYAPPNRTVSREDLEKDLKYLFGLGLTAESGNETLNDRLAKWKALTGENYVYSSEGGRRRKMRKTRTAKRKMHKISKSKKYRR